MIPGPRLLFLPLVALLAACGDAPTASIPSDTPPLDPAWLHTTIRDGGIAPSEHRFVVVIANTVDAMGEQCSAVHVGSGVLLTARHCVSPMTTGTIDCPLPGNTSHTLPLFGPAPPASHFQIMKTAGAAFEKSKVTKIVVEEGMACGRDTAVVVLDREIDVPTAPLATRSAAKGDVLTVVGAGSIEPSDAPVNDVYEHGATVVAVGPDSVAGSTAVDREFLTDPVFCHGDSGGAAIDKDGHLVGIVSRVSGGGACVDAGNDVFEDVFVRKAWLASFLPSDADAGAGDGGGGDGGTEDSGAPRAAATTSGCNVATPGAWSARTASAGEREGDWTTGWLSVGLALAACAAAGGRRRRLALARPVQDCERAARS